MTQQHRQGDFGRHESTPNVMSGGTAGSVTAFFERGCESICAPVREGREAEQETCPGRHSEGKEYNGRVDADIVRPRQAGRVETNQRVQAEVGNPQAEHATCHGEDPALGHRLPEQAAAAGAQRRAHRKLTTA